LGWFFFGEIGGFEGKGLYLESGRNKIAFEMSKIRQISVQGKLISIDENDYISLTDIENNEGYQTPELAVNNWLKRPHTLSYLHLWETKYNENFNSKEMKSIEEGVINGSIELTLEDYLKRTDAVGLIIKSDTQSSIFAHSDIFYDYCGWGSPHTKLRIYLLKEFQRLKEEEAKLTNSSKSFFLTLIEKSEKVRAQFNKKQDINNPNRSLWTVNLEEE